MAHSDKKTINIQPIASISERAPTLLQPDLRLLYSNRAKRLRVLAPEHSMQAYLEFVAHIVDGQEKVIKELPFQLEDVSSSVVVDWKTAPFQKLIWKRDAYWQQALDLLLKHMGDTPLAQNEVITSVLKQLADLDAEKREAYAQQLLESNFNAVGSDVAPFIWAALSLYWAQLSRAYKLDLQEAPGVERYACPVCGGDPVASVITMGPPDGLRYLHCNLCEAEWHYVRTQCSNCEQTEKLEYWTLDEESSPIKTESCGDCMSHLKVFHQNDDPTLDPVADDLASLALDAYMEEKGFARSSFNPFLFPQEVVE